MAVAEVTHEAATDRPAWDARARTRSSYDSMRQRCLNPNATAYRWYGARGITVCERWLGPGGFDRFVEDLGWRPEGMTLDRYPNRMGNYEPGNTRWANKWAQANNKTTNRRLTINGTTKTVAEWAHEESLRPVSLYRHDDAGAVRRIVNRRKRRCIYLELYRKSGSLYGDGWEIRFARGFAETLAEQTGPWVESSSPGATAWEESEDDPATHPGTQRDAYIWGLTPPPASHAYECGDCQKLFSIGFGCTLCMGAMCAACFDGEHHACHGVHGSHTDGVERYGLTLEEVGETFGFTRERARQIERRALGRLRPVLLGAVPNAARLDGASPNAWGAYE